MLPHLLLVTLLTSILPNVVDVSAQSHLRVQLQPRAQPEERRIGFNPSRSTSTKLERKYHFKQNTSKNIAKRARRKAMIPRNKLTARDAQSSPKPFPTCTSGNSDGTGYAVFNHYNAEGYNTASPFIYLGSKNVLQCEMQCDAIDECDAVYYDGNERCYLKTDSILTATLVAPEETPSIPDAMAIKGTCAELSQYYDESTMAACCDNPPPPNRFPVCSAPYSSGSKSGYAVFPMFDLLAGDVTDGVGGISLSQCLETCREYGAANANGDETRSCIGYTYRFGNCYQKALDITQGNFIYHNEEDLVTFIAGGCQGVSSFATPEALAACCNDL